MSKNEFEVVRVERRTGMAAGIDGCFFLVEVNYPAKFYSSAFIMYGRDEMDVVARLYRMHAKDMEHMFKVED